MHVENDRYAGPCNNPPNEARLFALGLSLMRYRCAKRLNTQLLVK